MLAACVGLEAGANAPSDELVLTPTDPPPTLTAIVTKIPRPTKTPEATPPELKQESSGKVIYLSNGRINTYDPGNKDTSLVLTLPGDTLSGASLSPDGTMVAYSNPSGLFLLDIQNGSPVYQVNAEEKETYVIKEFNPRAPSSYVSLLVRKDTSSGTSFFSFSPKPQPTWLELPTLPGYKKYGCDTGTAWSPTGDRLVISGQAYGLSCSTNSGLTLINLKRGQAIQLIENKILVGLNKKELVLAGTKTPAWHPDGQSIFFSMDETSNDAFQYTSHIYQISADGTNLKQISQNIRGVASYPYVTASDVLYYSVSGYSPQTDGIHLQRLSDNIDTLLIKGAGLCPISVSPDNSFLIVGHVCNENRGAVELRIWDLGKGTSQTVTRNWNREPAFFLGWQK